MTSHKRDAKKDKLTTKLSRHKRFKKELKPPFFQIPTLKPSSWVNDRLPEMIWASLIVGNLDREKALELFRFIADYVHKNPECYDLTITGISKLEASKRSELISNMLSWSNQIKTVLRPLILFPELPGWEEWKNILGEPIPEEDWQSLYMGVSKTLWHQSQEATDCRWIKVLAIVVGGKLHFPQNMEDDAKGILEYPNYGDLKRVRPSIRAAEISFTSTDLKWANHFWQLCFNETACLPEEGVNEKIGKRRKNLSEEMEKIKRQFFDRTKETRYKLIDHFFSNAKSSAINSRHEGAFGLAFFGMAVFMELLLYRMPLSITARLNIRVLVETLVTFKYLLIKEKTDPTIWDGYRSYGTGQLKLLYLKLEELNKAISSVDIKDLEMLVNEDRWIEFISINLGHWDSKNLREMSEETGLKELYDTYYSYTSGYAHANWGAVRESIYQRCLNPLHRLHRVPIFEAPLMPSVIVDSTKIMNRILECLSEAYPKFDFRLSFDGEVIETPEKQNS